MKELETEIWCPGCKSLYGRVFRQEVRDGMFVHVTDPATIPKYCGVCDRPTERKS